MKAPRIILVEGTLEQYSEMVQKESAAGRRVGWLDMNAATALPERFDRAGSIGVFRAVEVGATATLSCKPRKGSVVLKDLLREHFLGCSVVLVRGYDQAPELADSN